MLIGAEFISHRVGLCVVDMPLDVVRGVRGMARALRIMERMAGGHSLLQESSVCNRLPIEQMRQGQKTLQTLAAQIPVVRARARACVSVCSPLVIARVPADIRFLLSLKHQPQVYKSALSYL